MSENKIKNNGQDLAALKAMQVGVNILADTVSGTLGPKGRNVVIRKKHFVTATKDGVTVAMQVDLTDPYENAGAQMVKEVALKTNQVAGDGTTTATVLAQAIVNAGIKNIAAGANPMDIKRGIDLAVKAVVKHIRENAEDIGEDYEKVKQIGTISANNDEKIGAMIANAMETIGKDGVIYIEESRLITDTVEFIEGLQVNQGYISPYFVTDSSRGNCVLNDPLILLYDGKITSVGPILKLLQAVINENKQLIIIADDLDGETLATMIANKNKGVVKWCAIRAPFGDNSKDMMRDIAVNTGAVYVTEDEGVKLENVTLDYLGTCDKIIISKEITTIIGGKGDEDKIAEHVLDLKQLIETAGSTYEVGQFKDRIAKLSKGIAVMYVGGHTESEIREKKDRIEDALNATRAAVEEGIIPGGGVVYVRAIADLDSLITSSPDESTGVGIIKTALTEPLRKICENGALSADVIVAKVLDGGIKNRYSKGHYDYGFNARTETFGDLIGQGVIDPAKVARVALENAASVATLILTTSAIIVD